MQQSWILCIWKDLKRIWQRRKDSSWCRSSKQYILCNNINVLYRIGSQSSLPLSTRKTLTSARSDFSYEADTALDNFFWTRTMHCISGCSSSLWTNRWRKQCLLSTSNWRWVTPNMCCCISSNNSCAMSSALCCTVIDSVQLLQCKV